MARPCLSCLWFHIQQIQDTVKTLYFFSDACPGQNRNKTMVQFCYCLVHLFRFRKVVHYLPVRGHSFLRCDTDFAALAKIRKAATRIYTPVMWMEKFAESHKVHRVPDDLKIYDFQSTLSEFFRPRVRGMDGSRFNVSKYKIFQYYKDRRYVTVSENMSGQPTVQFNLVKPNVQLAFQINPVYTTGVPINRKKLSDIANMFKYMDRASVQYYQDIPCAQPGNDDEDEDAVEGDLL